MKSLYIILTRSETVLSRMVYLLTRDTYTHASLAFDEALDTLYTSSRKNGRTLFPAGPCREYLHAGYLGRHPHIPCAVYELRVSDEIYSCAVQEAALIMDNADEYHFNIIGLLLCRFDIPYHRKRHFFCSQFVGEVLNRSKAVRMPKAISLMRPSDYMSLPGLKCRFTGSIGELAMRVHGHSAASERGALNHADSFLRRLKSAFMLSIKIISMPFRLPLSW